MCTILYGTGRAVLRRSANFRTKQRLLEIGLDSKCKKQLV